MKKSILLAILSLIIAGLMITSVASIPNQNINPEENEIIAQYATFQSQLLPVKTSDASKNPLLFTGIPISGGDYDEFHGSVAGAPGGEYYAMAEYTIDGVTWLPMLYGSLDGVIWEEIGLFEINNSEYTDMDQNAYGTYGTCGAPPDNNGVIFLVDGEMLQVSGWDFAPDNLCDFSNNRIACYTHEGPEGDPGSWNWGCITLTGYNGYGDNDYEDCPFIFYPNSVQGGLISWMSTSGCKHVGSTMDLETNIHYAVYDVNDSGNYDLIVRRTDFGTWQYNTAGYWYHPGRGTIQVTSNENLQYPSAVAYNNNVIVACQKGHDVVVYYSTDGFNSKTEKLVQGFASYPEIAVAAGGFVIITYIKDNQIWYRTSDTGGASWSVAKVLSDNQVNLNDRAVNLDEYYGNIIGVWEDIRGNNIDIYYDFLYDPPYDPPESPNIDGPTEGAAGEELCWTFHSYDPNDNQVKYIIDWGDETSYETDFNPSCTPVEACYTYEDQEEYTIKAYAVDETGLTSSSSTYTVTITKPRSRTVYNTLFQQLFERFPKAFPILRYLLGFQ